MSERCHFDIDSLVSLSWSTCASLNPLRKSRYRWCNLGEEQTRNRWIEFTKVIYGLFYILWQQFLCSLLLFALVLCSLLPMIFFNAPCSLPSILTLSSQLPTRHPVVGPYVGILEISSFYRGVKRKKILAVKNIWHLILDFISYKKPCCIINTDDVLAQYVNFYGFWYAIYCENL